MGAAGPRLTAVGLSQCPYARRSRLPDNPIRVWPFLLAGVVLIVVGLVWGSLVGWPGIEMVPMALGAGFFGVGVARILKGD